MKKASFEVALKGKKQIAEGTWAFTFEKPKGFNFRAGQHVRMTLLDTPETDAEGDSRFFSLACTPQDENLIIALRMRDTAFKRVLKAMRPGQKVLIQIMLGVPKGAFALHQDAAKPAVFVVGGIGIVPAYAMIKDATERKLPHKLTLLYSNRRPEDAPFLSELQDLARQNPSFTFVPTMTEPEKSAIKWQGETGYIDQAMLKKYVADAKTPIYYVSGLPEMVSAMKKLLIDSGVDQARIKAEEFEGFNLNKLPNEAGKPTWKRHVLLVALVFVIGMVAIGHAGAAASLSGGTTSFNHPVTYMFGGLMAALIIVKVRYFSRLHHKNRKRGA
jgi:ferredoxin-NADP reductase